MGTNGCHDGPRLPHLNQWLHERDHARVTPTQEPAPHTFNSL